MPKGYLTFVYIIYNMIIQSLSDNPKLISRRQFLATSLALSGALLLNPKGLMAENRIMGTRRDRETELAGQMIGGVKEQLVGYYGNDNIPRVKKFLSWLESNETQLVAKLGSQIKDETFPVTDKLATLAFRMGVWLGGQYLSSQLPAPGFRRTPPIKPITFKDGQGVVTYEQGMATFDENRKEIVYLNDKLEQNAATRWPAAADSMIVGISLGIHEHAHLIPDLTSRKPTGILPKDYEYLLPHIAPHVKPGEAIAGIDGFMVLTELGAVMVERQYALPVKQTHARFIIGMPSRDIRLLKKLLSDSSFEHERAEDEYLSTALIPWIEHHYRGKLTGLDFQMPYSMNAHVSFTPTLKLLYQAGKEGQDKSFDTVKKPFYMIWGFTSSEKHRDVSEKTEQVFKKLEKERWDTFGEFIDKLTGALDSVFGKAPLDWPAGYV